MVGEHVIVLLRMAAVHFRRKPRRLTTVHTIAFTALTEEVTIPFALYPWQVNRQILLLNLIGVITQKGPLLVLVPHVTWTILRKGRHAPLKIRGQHINLMDTPIRKVLLELAVNQPTKLDLMSIVLAQIQKPLKKRTRNHRSLKKTIKARISLRVTLSREHPLTRKIGKNLVTPYVLPSLDKVFRRPLAL